MSGLEKRFGKRLEISNVVIGWNLNLPVIRGFARLDQLAFISQPDVYDQLKNELGTQREPDKSHASEALDYALGSVDADPMEDPHAFSEIILNVRDASVVQLSSGGSEISLDDPEFASTSTLVGDVTVKNDLIDENRQIDPQISRVDGNHRLLKVRERIEAHESENELVFPSVPFAMFVGLTADQERALFKDINGQQKSMNTSHLAQIRHRLEGDTLLMSPKSDGRALWIAEKLQEPGYVFHGRVFKGGSRKAFREEGLSVPPVSINSLKGAVLKTLKASDRMETIKVENATRTEMENLVDTYTLRVNLLNMFWSAVAKAYDAGWQDTKNYVVLQAIGLSALSKLAARVIDDAIENNTTTQDHFDNVLTHIANQISLEKRNHDGLAGEAGAAKVFSELNAARSEGFEIAQVIQSLMVPPTSPLDE